VPWNVNTGAVAERVVWSNESPAAAVRFPPVIIISHTLVALGKVLVSVSVTVGFAAVVVPVVIVHSQV
jgi:hypothetical protein